jgi:hypothetical protein
MLNLLRIYEEEIKQKCRMDKNEVKQTIWIFVQFRCVTKKCLQKLYQPFED